MKHGRNRAWAIFFLLAFVFLILAFIFGANRQTDSSLYRFCTLFFSLIISFVAFLLGIQFLKIFWKHDHATYFYLFCALSSLAFFWVARAFATPIGKAGSIILFDASEILSHLVAAIFVALAVGALIRKKPFLSEKLVIGLFLGSYYFGASVMWFISQYSPYFAANLGSSTFMATINTITFLTFGFGGWIFTRYSKEHTYSRLDLIGVSLILVAISIIFRILSDPWTLGWWIYHTLFLTSLIIPFFSLRALDRRSRHAEGARPTTTTE